MLHVIEYAGDKPRNYDEKATVTAVVKTPRVFFDEGYRVADKGDEVAMSPDDFAVCSEAGQVEEAAPPEPEPKAEPEPFVGAVDPLAAYAV